LATSKFCAELFGYLVVLDIAEPKEEKAVKKCLYKVGFPKKNELEGFIKKEEGYILPPPRMVGTFFMPFLLQKIEVIFIAT